MNIQISKTTQPCGTVIQATTDKKFVEIIVSSYIQVVYRNAAHTTHRGSGRFFDTWDQAVAGYKNATIIAMIEAARESL